MHAHSAGTYLYEAVCRCTIPKIGYGECTTTFYLTNTHGELGNGTLPYAVIGGVEVGGVYGYRLYGGRQEIEEETERDAECEAIPELGYGVC